MFKMKYLLRLFIKILNYLHSELHVEINVKIALKFKSPVYLILNYEYKLNK
jgi:hypothetical protein